MRYHLNWKVLPSIGLGGDKMPVGLRRLLEDGGGLRVSKPTLITLSEIERREGGVPVSAVKYSFSYPHPDPHGHLEKTIKQLERTTGDGPLPAWKNFVSWLQLGGGLAPAGADRVGVTRGSLTEGGNIKPLARKVMR